MFNLYCLPTYLNWCMNAYDHSVLYLLISNRIIWKQGGNLQNTIPKTHALNSELKQLFKKPLSQQKIKQVTVKC